MVVVVEVVVVSCCGDGGRVPVVVMHGALWCGGGGRTLWTYLEFRSSTCQSRDLFSDNQNHEVPTVATFI